MIDNKLISNIKAKIFTASNAITVTSSSESDQCAARAVSDLTEALRILCEMKEKEEKEEKERENDD